MDLLKPKSVEIEDMDGNKKTFILSRLPATDGREVAAKYPVNILPKVGDYKVSEEIMFKLLSFAAVETENGTIIRLQTKALVNNHCNDWEALGKLELAMLEYNQSFFGNGKSFDFFSTIEVTLRQWITRILTDSSAQSSRAGKRRSRN